MINPKYNPVEWAMLAYNLGDIKDHIEELIVEMDDPEFSEIEFGIMLGHIYEHLNLAWNSRNLTRDYSDEERAEMTKFPVDLCPEDMSKSDFTNW